MRPDSGARQVADLARREACQRTRRDPGATSTSGRPSKRISPAVGSWTWAMQFARVVREIDGAGARLLPDSFYRAVGRGDREWEAIVATPWAPVFEAAAETLAGQPISPATLERVRAAGVTVPQLVEALFFMLVIGASHRFSVAFGVEESCPVPATLQAGRTPPKGQPGKPPLHRC